MNKKKYVFSVSTFICLPFFLGALWKTGIYNLLDSDLYIRFFALDMEKILNGEWWRVITFIMQPPGQTALWTLLAVSFLFILGNHIEELKGKLYLAAYFFFSGAVQVLIAYLFYAQYNRIVWLDLRIWWLTLIPILLCLDSQRSVYMLTPRPIRVVYLLIPVAIFITALYVLGTVVNKISLTGQIGSALVWVGGTLLKKVKDKRQSAAVS